MANVFGMDEDIQNRSSIWLTAILFAFDERSSMNFGLDTLEI